MTNDRFVLDASAILALLNEEAGAARVLEVIGRGLVSTVNAAEVMGKLADYKMSNDDIYLALNIGFDLVPFGEDELSLMGIIRRATSKHGLSLGDRACLATGMRHRCRIITADRAWAAVDLRGLDIEILRRD